MRGVCKSLRPGKVIMGEIREPGLVKLVCGVITGELELLPEVRAKLETHFGPVDLESSPFAFDFTDYYREEMGGNLWRIFWAFRNPADPGALADIKIKTNEIETEYMHGSGGRESGRRINLDPGYITENKLVLATTKDFPHRIYLRDGIFAEITLHFRKKSCVYHERTFPDFKSRQYEKFLLEARDAARTVSPPGAKFQ